MRDRNLEKNIERVEAFVERWKQFSQFLDRGFKGESFANDEEAAFLELKSAIAQEHELLMTTLNSESSRDDKALRLLNTVPSMQGFKELPENMGKKLANDWHSEFISLQALLGRLRGRQAQLAAISIWRVGFKNVLANPFVILFVMLAAAYGVYKFTDDVVPELIKMWETKK